MATFAEVTENECINERHPLVGKGNNLTNTAQELGNGARSYYSLIGCRMYGF